TILHDDISVLYHVGSFGVNIIKAMLLILCQLAFLAALAVLAGTFLSFPVSCLLCFSVLPFSLARDFLTTSVRLEGPGVTTVDIFTYMGHWIVKAMKFVLPDFNSTFPNTQIVDGMCISWTWVGQTAGIVFALQTALLLAIACLVFHNRELARVQV
ncbi:MAG: hypothetical protein J7M14_03220, partial [Planctomycetes bacterium]|nr:hypothetical protein [Planctomycetota bacterium]